MSKKRTTVAELEKSTAARIAQVYDVVQSLDRGVATRDKVNKVHERVTKLEEEFTKWTGIITISLSVMVIVLVVIIGRIF